MELYYVALAWWDTYALLFALLLLVPSVFSLGAAIVVRLAAPTNMATSHLFAAIFATSYVSSVIGFLLGSSRDSVVGDVLPMLMAGFGALAVYAVIEQKVGLVTASGGAIVVAAFVTAGTFLGIQFRLISVDFQPHILNSDQGGNA